jgi:RimJ/RimL family protein N-acetyltransferase/anti-anti-sigma regulatory factor
MGLGILERETERVWRESTEPPWAGQLRLRGALTHRTARSFCRRAQDLFETGAPALTLNLEDVKLTDVVGLAALHQTADLAERLGVRLTVVSSAEVKGALLEAGLVDTFMLETALPVTSPPTVADLADSLGAPAPVIARTPRLILRQPSWDELALFERWAYEPLLDQMVGSELLYRCRGVGAYAPEFVALVLHDSTSLTLLVEAAGEPTPMGFLRLYGIHLGQGFAFLETAMVTRESLRRGWGISASRLLLAYACDALRIHRIEAKVYAYNTLSVNALRRNGFQQEGVLRQARTYEGQRWDILVFSILDAEMQAQRASESFPSMGLWD